MLPANRFKLLPILEFKGMQMSRAAATQQDKYVAFRTAYQNITHYREQKNFIAAYVVAFSLIEDRIRAMFVVRHRATDGKELTDKQIAASFSSHVCLLSKEGDIQPDDAVCLLEEAKQRNKLMHTAMWNLNAFTEESVERVIKLTRVADRYRQTQKKKLGHLTSL